ncbi:response regulator [Desulfobacterium sp. N47]
MNRQRILIVDDSPTMRKVIILQLSTLDVEILVANDGRLHGFDMVSNHPVDLVVTDVDMPQMDGITLCKKLQADPKTDAIPIVIQSSFDSELNIEKGFNAGASAYISKKELTTSLVGTVRSLLRKSSINRTRRVMVVDDSAMIRKIVGQGLEKKGFQVITAENGKAALALIDSNLPHLILSDVNMPEMDGYAFCRAVHEDSGLSDIPFVVMSVRQEMSRVRRMLSLGAEAYLFKPFNIDELVILIEKLLSDQYHLLLMEKERLSNERKLVLSSIASLATALEARDAYTPPGHSAEVARIVSQMGLLAGLDEEKVNRLRKSISGELHDIGKIGVKDAVLLKPGRLTEEEFEAIKQHPVTGANILRPIDSFSDIIEVVQHHHEHFDDKGYPNGLKGEAIPFWARMIAVADTYNALTSDRPYRKGMTAEKALQIIKEASGTQLCPDCVDLFFKCTDRWGRHQGP